MYLIFVVFAFFFKNLRHLHSTSNGIIVIFVSFSLTFVEEGCMDNFSINQKIKKIKIIKDFNSFDLFDSLINWDDVYTSYPNEGRCYSNIQKIKVWFFECLIKLGACRFFLGHTHPYTHTLTFVEVGYMGNFLINQKIKEIKNFDSFDYLINPFLHDVSE